MDPIKDSTMMVSLGSNRTIAGRTLEIIWAIALICLPITSFPLFASITSGLVAPLSIIPFFILLLLWVVPLVIHKGFLPKETMPLVVFTLAAILSCAAAYYFYIPGFKGKTVTGQEIRALFTLAVGLTFFLVTATWVKDTARLKNTWKYITIGGMISLAWAAVQAYFIYKQYNFYPSWVDQIQSLLVIHSPSFYPNTGRITGMTYEASWFAHQMVIVYLPIWLAATYHQTSAFRFRLWRFSLENFLLILGLVAFFLSSPRIGLVSLLLMAIYVFIRLNITLQRKVVSRLSKSKLLQKDGAHNHHKSLLSPLVSLAIFCIYFLVLGGAILLAIQHDWRLATLVSNPPTPQEIAGLLTLDQTTLLSLSNRFIFLERMVYWLNGWNVFNQFPWLGVGLGNAGFFFPQLAPSMGWSSAEIRNVLYYFTQLPNVKSLWFRLLAETGLLGFSVYIAWFYTLYQSSRFSQHHPEAAVKTLAFAGQLALLAFIGEGFSIDSFAMPYFWVMAGIVAGTALMFRQQIRSSNRSS
jgi:hypothetical protein